MESQDLQHPFLFCALIVLNIPLCVLLGRAVYGNRQNWLRQIDRLTYSTHKERMTDPGLGKTQLTLAGIITVFIILVVSEYAIITNVITK